jgi:hypothetical protein
LDFCPGGRSELRRQLEENPDWEGDLLALYGFDIWDAIDGRVPIRRAYALLGRLPHEPQSIWRAKELGGSELKDYSKYLGWNAGVYTLADLIDAVNINTRTLQAINSPEGTQLPEFKPYPRPDFEEVEKPAAASSLDDFAGKLFNMFGPGIAP